MANTGNNQASIAYKVRSTDGAPLDIYGKPTNESGLKQAIALLSGTANPNPAIFTVEFYFQAGDIINGIPTLEYDPAACPAGILYITPSRLVLAPSGDPATVKLYSDGAWAIVGVPTPYLANVVPSAGNGNATLTFEPLAQQGQGNFYFQNTQTGEVAAVYVIVTDNPDLWILATGFWNNLGFWKNDGIWNY